MDRELSELKRAVGANPGDVALVRRYEAALIRSGERWRLRERYRLKFLCSYVFKDMSADNAPERWACVRCRRRTFFVNDRKQLVKIVSEGQCAVVVLSCLEVLDALIDHPHLHSAAEAEPPCVARGSPPRNPNLGGCWGAHRRRHRAGRQARRRELDRRRTESDFNPDPIPRYVRRERRRRVRREQNSGPDLRGPPRDVRACRKRTGQAD